MGRPFPLLDGYRAMAALMVLTTHVAFSSGEVLTPVLGPILGRLDFGVTLFFLLSGFLLYRPWARSAMVGTTDPNVGVYALRRGVRILPAYWAMVVVTLIALSTFQTVEWSAWPVHLGLLHIYIPGFALDGLTQTWSLATEVAFYAVLPVLAWMAGRRGRGNPSSSARFQVWVLAAAAAASWLFLTVTAVGGLSPSPLSVTWLPGFLDWFALGMLAAVIQVRLTLPDPPGWMSAIRTLADSTGWCLAIAGGVALLAITPIAGPVTLAPASPGSVLVKHALYAIIAAFLLLPGFLGIGNAAHPRVRESWWGRLLASEIVVYLGTVSYGIFLWHMILIVLLQRALGLPVFGGGFWLLWALVVIASVGAASASWFALESPLQSWVGRVTSRSPQRPTRADEGSAERSRPGPPAGPESP
jgi:peptidoglycan/LPS O-acetylase OafA/YrhL